jgi:hypothetical protein
MTIYLNKLLIACNMVTKRGRIFLGSFQIGSVFSLLITVQYNLSTRERDVSDKNVLYYYIFLIFAEHSL